MKSALVIDDHPITHLGANRLLRELGYDRIGQAMSGEDALAQLSGGDAPDLIVLDISLPGRGGLDLVTPLRDAAPDARILVFSMNDQTGFAARALQAGAQGFLSKNAPPADFREGFVLWRGIGVDYEGGVLDGAARIAIHVTHRLGAVAAAAMLLWAAVAMVRTPGLRGWGVLLALLTVAQVTLGILNVKLSLPIEVAVMHNGGAALLVFVMVSLLARLRGID